MEIEKQFLDRIDAILARSTQMSRDHTVAHDCLAAVVIICEAVYGTGSVHVKRLTDSIDQIKKTNPHIGYILPELSYVVEGTLKAVREDVAGGKLRDTFRRVVADLILDFTNLAERALDEGRIDVASVLAAAAFEDLMRRRAQDAAINVAEKDLSDVINSLKAAGLLSGPQAKVATSYVTFRNKALHAEWDKIAGPELAGLIAFVRNSAAVE